MQIVAANTLSTDHRTKVAKYRDIPGIKELLTSRYDGVATVSFHAVTLSYRGIWCKKSYLDMNEGSIRECNE